MENHNIDFENMGIYDLRNYARSIGVVSPTKFRRDELIQKITAIIMGQQPEKKKTNKGRPPKHKLTAESKLDFILPNNMFDNNDPKYKSFVSQYNTTQLTADMLRDNAKTCTTNILFDGIYKPYDVNFGFALQKGYLSNYYKENVVVLKEMAQQYKLEEGDHITGSCCYLQNKNLMLATEVLKINGEPAEDERQLADLSKIEQPNKKIILDNNNLIDYTIIDKICPMAKGTRVLIDFEDKDQVKTTVAEILNRLTENNGVYSFLFSIDDLPEDVYGLAQLCPYVQLVNLKFNMDRTNFADMASLKIKHIQRLVQQGNDVAIVCYNVKNYQNNLATNAVINNGLNQQSALEYAKNQIKDMFCLARNLQQGSLTTIFINDSTQSLVDVCNTYVYFNAENFPQTDIKVDVKKSFTRNMQNFATATDIEDLKQFKTGLNNQNILQKLEVLFKE